MCEKEKKIEILIEDIGKRTKWKEIICLARCHCGREFESRLRYIKNNIIKNCKHCFKQKNYIGKLFGNLIAIESTKKIHKNNSVIWKCYCIKCNKYILISSTQMVKKVKVKCGCYIPKSHLHDKNRRHRSGSHGRFVKKILERDKYYCDICKNNDDKMTVHHLDGWSWSIVGRFDPTNCVSLCRYCHTLFHKIYSQIDNTRFQFLDFKRDYASLLQL